MKRLTTMLLALAMSAVLIGCGSKISKANYEKVKEGMTRAEVVAILGEPTGTELLGQINEKELKGPVWQGGSFKIVTLFGDDGKLTVKRLDTE